MKKKIFRYLPVISILCLTACNDTNYFKFKIHVPEEYEGTYVYGYLDDTDVTQFTSVVKKKMAYKNKDWTLVYSTCHQIASGQTGPLLEYLTFLSADGKKIHADYMYSEESEMWELSNDGDNVPYRGFEDFITHPVDTKWPKKQTTKVEGHYQLEFKSGPNEAQVVVRIRDDYTHICDYYRYDNTERYLFSFTDKPLSKIPHLDAEMDVWEN